MSRIEVKRKIVDYSVSQDDASAEQTPTSSPQEATVIRMHEKLERPEMLVGSTYKVKTPVSEHAMYVTINDIVLNEGTVHEKRRPFEVFINSKNLDHYQWIVALTRIMSAVFRKGGEEQKKIMEKKRADFEARDVQRDAFAENTFPDGAQLCGKCNTAASVMMDGCLTCLNCGYSKCG